MYARRNSGRNNKCNWIYKSIRDTEKGQRKNYTNSSWNIINWLIDIFCKLRIAWFSSDEEHVDITGVYLVGETNEIYHKCINGCLKVKFLMQISLTNQLRSNFLTLKLYKSYWICSSHVWRVPFWQSNWPSFLDLIECLLINSKADADGLYTDVRLLLHVFLLIIITKSVERMGNLGFTLLPVTLVA